MAGSQQSYRAKILSLLADREPGKTICPSEVLPLASKKNKTLMQRVRVEALALRDDGEIKILQKGREVTGSEFKGPIRLARPNHFLAVPKKAARKAK